MYVYIIHRMAIKCETAIVLCISGDTKTKMTRAQINKFEEYVLSSSLNEETKANMEELGTMMTSFKSIFQKPRNLAFPGLEYAFENAIISPSEYLMKTKNYNCTFVDVLSSKWSDILIKAHRHMCKKKCLIILVDMVKIMTGTHAHIVTEFRKEQFLQFMRKLKYNKRELNFEKIRAKHSTLTNDQVNILKTLIATI